MNRLFLVAFLLSIIVTFSWAVQKSSKQFEDDCLKCHEVLYNKAIFKNTLHSPFQKKECANCHSVKKTNFGMGTRRSSVKDESLKIKWFQNHYEPSETHFFLIPEDEADKVLLIKMSGNKGGTVTSSLKVPPLDQLEKIDNEKEQPEIKDIRVSEVKHGVLVSATLRWNTNKPCDSQVFYGEQELKSKSPVQQQYSLNHTVVIAPLKKNETYKYIVVSKDIYGNISKSSQQSFTTKKSTFFPEESSGEKMHAESTGFNYTIRASGDNYFLKVSVANPTFMKLGRYRDSKGRVKSADKTDANNLLGQHQRINNSEEVNIKKCLTCHSDYKSDSNHPINVGPKKGMDFPLDYPVLENGKMHCSTCHEEHSSNNEARIRKSSKQELCLGCHKNYG